MKNNNDFLKDLHIGNTIKEIASKKKIATRKIADAIYYNQSNADKIFKMNNMDVEAVVRISYVLEENILELYEKKHLSHLPFRCNVIETEYCFLNIDINNKTISASENYNNCDFLKNTHIGQHIKNFAHKNFWNEQDVAKKLQCSQSTVSVLYKSKSIKLKKLIEVSYTLEYNFIADVYSSQMFIPFTANFLDNSRIIFSPFQIRVLDSNDNSTKMIFLRDDDKKSK